MSTITANCPNCGTRYELTEEQLSVAAGQVRCGACMTVFHATEKNISEVPVLDDENVLFGDDPLSDIDADSGNLGDGLSDSFKELLTDSSSYYEDNDFVSDEDALSHDEDWAEQLLEEEDQQEKLAAEAKALQEKADAAAEKQRQNDLRARDFDDIGFTTDDKAGLIGRITPEPLELRIADNTQLWINIALGSCAVFLILILCVQLFAFQFDDLSRSARWRSVSQSICAVAGCTLPEKFNINDISAKHLTVKSHDLYDQSLVVDSILTNHADIDQPFPLIELFFTDTQQQVVAARKFSPTEYLRGELSQTAMMPSRQPIHIALEIQDPGSQASGYFIQLRY